MCPACMNTPEAARIEHNCSHLGLLQHELEGSQTLRYEDKIELCKRVADVHVALGFRQLSLAKM